MNLAKDKRMNGRNLLPLKRMATQLGVEISWLRHLAEEGKLPAEQRGNQWLFRPKVVAPIVFRIAANKRKKGGAK